MNTPSPSILAALKLVQDLAFHLASEIDLHYEDPTDDAHADEVALLRSAAAMLTETGHEVPEVVTHILKKTARKFS